MSDAMIGVIGTLMGTILGWILGRLDFGRLHIAFDNFIYEFGAPGSLFHIHGVQPNEVHSYKLSTTIQLYNSSNRNMILRNASFIFSDGKTDLFSEEAYDDSTRRFVAKSLDYDKLEIVNIPPHQGLNYNVHIYTTKIDEILRCKKIYFCYKSEKLKTKRIHFKNVDYSQQPRLLEEDTANA